MKFKRILMFVGTRPECIKMLPIFLELRKQNFKVEICDTGQHTEMNSQVFKFFDVVPKYSLQSMKKGQSLSELSSKMLMKSSSVIQEYDPDIVLVHGDTMTSFIGAFTAFLNKVKVGHVEAGLRTNNKWSPFPEEMNRVLISDIADMHFTPTKEAQKNLLAEGIKSEDIFVVGNTAMDSLEYARSFSNKNYGKEQKKIIITIHRRENHGENLDLIINEIKTISQNFKNITIVIPVHPNPNIKSKFHYELGHYKNIILTEPMGYREFVEEILNADIIITDSGGIQEEVTFLGIPTLVVREYTERPEAITFGPCKLFPIIKEEISNEVETLLTDNEYYKSRSRKSDIFGDGSSAKSIIKHL